MEAAGDSNPACETAMSSQPATAHDVAIAPVATELPGADLFPQPFTPFEFYYLVEDRANYPSAFPIRLECRGPLNREAFERALRSTHARHPMLSARIECDTRGWPVWVAGRTSPIVWTNEASEHGVGEAASPGVNVRISRKGETTLFTLTFQHTAVDGLGAFQFITDLLVAYAHEDSGRGGPPPWRALEPERLRRRDEYQLFRDRVGLTELVRIARMSLPLLVHPAAVVSDEPPGSDDACIETAPEFLVHHLTADETTGLLRVAGASSVMLNDLLLRDLFLMLGDWNRDTREGRRAIRIMVPMNVRRREQYRMPAANAFSFSFLSRRLADLPCRTRLLAWVSKEMDAIKREKRGLYFEAGLRLFCIWPAMLRRALNRRWPFATAILSNLGTGFDNVPLPWRDGKRACGELLFEGGYGSAPIRPDTRVAFSVHTYAGRMTICASCDPQVFNPRQQRALLQAYVEQLRLTIRTGS
jgi:hypothetical protein